MIPLIELFGVCRSFTARLRKQPSNLNFVNEQQDSGKGRLRDASVRHRLNIPYHGRSPAYTAPSSMM